MSDRFYLFTVGSYILTALYLEINVMIYALVVVLLIESIFGFTIPLLTQKIRGVEVESRLLQYTKPGKFNFEALRVLRMFLGIVLFASYLAVHEYNIEMLWFFPWFFGFAVLGAGVSGVCPLYLVIRWLGFK